MGRKPRSRVPDTRHHDVASDRGGDRAAVLYTLIESAKLNRLDPEAYLADVIDRMAKGHPNSRLADLLPWYWKPAAAIAQAA